MASKNVEDYVHAARNEWESILAIVALILLLLVGFWGFNSWQEAGRNDGPAKGGTAHADPWFGSTAFAFLQPTPPVPSGENRALRVKPPPNWRSDPVSVIAAAGAGGGGTPPAPPVPLKPPPVPPTTIAAPVPPRPPPPARHHYLVYQGFMTGPSTGATKALINEIHTVGDTTESQNAAYFQAGEEVAGATIVEVTPDVLTLKLTGGKTVKVNKGNRLPLQR